jgi:cobyrinic acid a,c-diamide synthase
LLIAAPASGQGKTTVASALARLLARSGKTVRAFKYGPDFLDPYWLELASGHSVHQLDLWMTGEADCRARLALAAQEADLIIVEGVMGLFDGNPSAADLAQRFGLPVLAVIDASAMAGTFGALAFGLQHYRPDLRWAGVLANRVASVGHAQMLEEAAPGQWLGALHRQDALKLPERHLGLTVASEVSDALQRLDVAADAVAATRLGALALDVQASSAAWGVSFEHTPPPAACPRLLSGRRIAVARDAAFCFIYAANLDMLRMLGAEIVFCSPLKDAALPECDALWLPGGYPELHLAAISANSEFRESVAKHVAAGRPVWAECGGMMALFDSIVGLDQVSHAAWGLLPGTVRMQSRLAGLGPQQLRIGDAQLRGHTFHYSRCETALQPVARSSKPNTEPSHDSGEALYQQGSIRASYFHAWFASSPEATAQLFKGMS